MTIYEEVKAGLEQYPTARERSKKNSFLAYLIWNKMGLSVKPITKDILKEMIVEVSSYDRAWRQVLQLEPGLRGTDYGDKTALEQDAQLELGYQPGAAGMQKKLKTL